MMQEVPRSGIGSLLAAILTLGLFAQALRAEPADYEGKRIAVIAFDPPEQPLSSSQLARILPLKMKEPLRLDAVRTAIERLFATGRYSDIQVEAEAAGDGVAIRFRTTNNWFVGQVSVEGVKEPPSLAQLANATGLTLGSLYSDERRDEAVRNVERALEANGYFQRRVEPRFDYDPRTAQVHIRFAVDTGKRARFASPEVRGDPQRPLVRVIRATGWRGWFGWKTATESHLQRGLDRVRRSYQEQNHLMASVALEGMRYSAASRRVTPSLRVNAGPAVVVETTGYKISRGRLRRLVPVFEEQSVDRDLLMEGARNLTEHLQSEGYFDAAVSFHSRQAGAEEHIEFAIERGDRHKLVAVEIRGNRYFNAATIRERMMVAPASLEFRHGRYSDNLLRRDLDVIADLYRSNGFRDVEVSSEVEDDYRGRTGERAVVVKIEEGPQWFLSRLSLAGVAPGDEAGVRAALQSSEGQPFSELNVAADRDNILAYYYDNGYPNASFEWRQLPSEQPNRLELLYTVRPGPRQFVREVLINGLDATRPQLVHRRIMLNPGEPLSQTKMVETQRRLYELGIFAKVDAALQNPEGEEDAKYVVFQLDESRKYSITTGFGAEIARIGGSQTSFDSPAGEAGFSPRVSFDFSRLNFLGLGHTVSFKSRVSTLQRRGLVTYTAPQFRGNEALSLSFTGLWDDSRDVRTFSARRVEGSVQIGQRWTRSKTLLYRFAYRRVGVDQGTLKIAPQLIPLLAQPVRVGILAGSYVDDRRDDPTDSRKGTFNSLDLGLASKGFGSQTDFFRLLGRNSTYHRLAGRLVLARTLTFGLMQRLGKGPEIEAPSQDIPLPERFFAGGASSHRGFPENQAGPRDLKTGFPLGGKALLVSGTELRFPVLGDNLGGVLFHDAGNVYSSLGNISFRVRQRGNQDFDYMVHAAGLGVRYRTPVGPIRVDLAYSMNSPRFFGFKGTREELLFNRGIQTQQRISHFQFHFSLGQTF